MSVIAHPPPPAPVSLEERAKGGRAVAATMVSREGWETWSVVRWMWFSLIRP